MIYAARYESMRALVDFLTENCCVEAEGVQQISSKRLTAKAK